MSIVLIQSKAWDVNWKIINKDKSKHIHYNDIYMHNNIAYFVVPNFILIEISIFRLQITTGDSKHKISFGNALQASRWCRMFNNFVFLFTDPSPISALTLKSNESAITASWNHTVGNVESFKLNINYTTKSFNTTQTQFTFSDLNSAAQYNVTVYAQVGDGTFLSGPVSKTQYTCE